MTIKYLTNTLSIACLAAGLMSLSCGDPEVRMHAAPGSTASADSDGGAAGTGAADGLSGTDLPPVRAGENVVCDHEKASEDTGKGVKFAGYSYTVKDVPGCGRGNRTQCPAGSNIGKLYDFDCTMCPGGLSNINGLFKMYDEPDVTTPDPKDWRELLYFDGNYFENIIEGPDCYDGQRKKATAKGYYFCAQPGTLAGMKFADWWSIVLVYTDIEPAGAFGIEPGSTDLAFIGFNMNGSANDILIQLNPCWDSNGSKQNEYQYCKIGHTIKGRQCENPFDE